MATLSEMLANSVEKVINDPRFHEKLAGEIEVVVRTVIRNEIESILQTIQASTIKHTMQ